MFRIGGFALNARATSDQTHWQARCAKALVVKLTTIAFDRINQLTQALLLAVSQSLLNLCYHG